MRTTSVFINRLSEHGFPFAGKIKFTLMSEDPDFTSNKKPVTVFFINGKAKAQLIPNIFISKNVSTYYHYQIYAQHPVNSPTEVDFELVEEGDCIVPIKPSCLPEISIPPQQGYIPSNSASCNCQDYQGATSSSNGIHGLVPAATSSERNKFLKGDGTWEAISIEIPSIPEIPANITNAFDNLYSYSTYFEMSHILDPEPEYIGSGERLGIRGFYRYTALGVDASTTGYKDFYQGDIVEIPDKVIADHFELGDETIFKFRGLGSWETNSSGYNQSGPTDSFTIASEDDLGTYNISWGPIPGNVHFNGFRAKLVVEKVTENNESYYKATIKNAVCYTHDAIQKRYTWEHRSKESLLKLCFHSLDDNTHIYTINLGALDQKLLELKEQIDALRS